MPRSRKGWLRKFVAINIRFIPHRDQRYPTVGDWFWRYSTLHVRVSDMDNIEYNILVAVHELVEAYLCRRAAVDEQDVTKFDIEFEERRERGEVPENAEPGDDPKAPYYTQHQVATRVEKFLADALGVNWEEYDAVVNSL